MAEDDRVRLPERSVIARKFVVAEVNGEPYFVVDLSPLIGDHDGIYHSLLERLGVPHDRSEIKGENYRALSMGMTDIDRELQKISLYGGSGRFEI